MTCPRCHRDLGSVGDKPKRKAKAKPQQRVVLVGEPLRGPKYGCQFCGYFGGGWTEKGEKCPACSGRYSWLIAQDLEDEP